MFLLLIFVLFFIFSTFFYLRSFSFLVKENSRSGVSKVTRVTVGRETDRPTKVFDSVLRPGLSRSDPRRQFEIGPELGLTRTGPSRNENPSWEKRRTPS